MPKLIPFLANKIWLFNQQKHYAFFIKQKENVANTQNQLLLQYLSKNQHTVYGKKHQFNAIKNYQQYASLVPIIEDYQQIKEYTGLLEGGKQNVLTNEDVLFFEQTSGSTSASKLIPYTQTLKHEFQKAVAIWMHDLFNQNAAIFSGKAYWSLSPALGSNYYTKGGIRVGTDTDKEYFSLFTGFMLNQIFATPQYLSKIQHPHLFYVHTLRYLLRAEDLSFISVWSPSFLLQLDVFLKTNLSEILDTSLLSKKRKEKLNNLILGSYIWKDIWPNLQLVSCWTDAQAALWQTELSHTLGNVPIQGKGLLLTEGVVSIPIENGNSAIAYTCQFYEFRHFKTQKIYLINELLVDEVYEIILTTGGGLYRYATKDLVKVTGYLAKIPRVVFVGRSNNCSDMVGEKLHEHQVNLAIEKTLNHFNINSKQVYVYAVKNTNQAHYQVLINANVGQDFANYANQQLMENPYYNQALDTNQLSKLVVKTIDADFSNQLLLDYKNRKKIKDGNIKLPILYQVGDLVNLLNY